jgi:hypothetical protein
MLGVSHDVIEFSGDKHDANDTDNILKITTDVPGGWTASVWEDFAGTVPVPDDWLSIVHTSGAGGAQPDEMRLFISSNRNPGSRTGYVHIEAGRLFSIVKIIQNTN